MPGTPELVAAVAAVAALLAWFESWRMRRTQERDFNFQRSADVRLDHFVYFADRDLPQGPAPRDELRFRVKNVGRAFAAELNFAVENKGLLNCVQMGLGLPPGVHSELTIVLSPDPELGPREIIFLYRYDDFRRHWGEVRLAVSDGSHKHYGQCRQPRILSARLDRAPNSAITESDVFMTPMRSPGWYDSLSLPFRRWRFRRDQPELFDRSRDDWKS